MNCLEFWAAMERSPIDGVEWEAPRINSYRRDAPTFYPSNRWRCRLRVEQAARPALSTMLMVAEADLDRAVNELIDDFDRHFGGTYLIPARPWKGRQ
jgi:hypothetical protein